jgi:hypothetical protein
MMAMLFVRRHMNVDAFSVFSSLLHDTRLAYVDRVSFENEDNLYFVSLTFHSLNSSLGTTVAVKAKAAATLLLF